MSWFKVDDKLAFHPKIIAAGNSAIGLWIRAGAWSADQNTDGIVPKYVPAILGARPADIQRLIQCGLWLDDGDSYRMHDWNDYQPTRADKESESGGKSTGGKLGAHRRWHRQQPSPDCQYCKENMGTSHAEPITNP